MSFLHSLLFIDTFYRHYRQHQSISGARCAQLGQRRQLISQQGLLVMCLLSGVRNLCGETCNFDRVESDYGLVSTTEYSMAVSIAQNTIYSYSLQCQYFVSGNRKTILYLNVLFHYQTKYYLGFAQSGYCFVYFMCCIFLVIPKCNK